MSLLKSQHTILIVLLTILLTPSINVYASCWEDFPWGTKEKTFVKTNWVKTQVSETITAYMELEKIIDGQIKRQWVFIDEELVRFRMTLFSLSIPKHQLEKYAWGPCFEKLGAADEEWLSLGNLVWNRPDLDTMASGGIKGDSYWVLASYIPRMMLLLKVGQLIPNIN